ncbi:CDGP domain-containing protein [Mycobacterium vicinigordonae]|uniref:CDGP domain-containing protein n=1 Tax=Mycobacterium vicinigordonae TaxID=1719132 RepID=A0A7D6IB05_9MYCO|nr:hypothetical protein [Mycobacterium vicinigordonae]QLL09177.1 hypothetical protein H0P51_10010 [Mycobacterium vicinigordonae]
MKHRIVAAAAAAVLMAGGLIAAASPAHAGCVYGGAGILGKCDGPIQPDGSWQRCVAFAKWVPNGASSYMMPDQHCDVMGPDQRPADPAFADPPMHIDD